MIDGPIIVVFVGGPADGIRWQITHHQALRYVTRHPANAKTLPTDSVVYQEVVYQPRWIKVGGESLYVYTHQEMDMGELMKRLINGYAPSSFRIGGGL